jgi:glycosyltransferase involved in cell wall biosynthesis
VRIAVVSKALVAPLHQRQMQVLAALPDVELLALAPPSWLEPRVGRQRLEPHFIAGYRLETLPILLNGRHHLHFYPDLGRRLRRFAPDVLHIDEEAFNSATFLALRAGLALRARCCFFNWANIDRYYPPPFNLFERYVFRYAGHAIAGNQEAADIMRRHGYAGPLSILPQVGVDPDIFVPAPPRAGPPLIGYLGRLVPEKGLADLLDAFAELCGDCRLRIIGDGVLRDEIRRRLAKAPLAGRAELLPALPGSAVPAALRELDVLVLPSRSVASWKEQFGRVLIEAMSCGLAVVGSDSGEIPNVLGDAGMVVPQANPAALRAALQSLVDDAHLRAEYGRRGRARVLAGYTQAALAQRYHAVYQSMLMPTQM